MVRIHPDPPDTASPGVAENHGGAIAQLGERLLCKQEVTGSIPVGSTRAAGAAAGERANNDGERIEDSRLRVEAIVFWLLRKRESGNWQRIFGFTALALSERLIFNNSGRR